MEYAEFLRMRRSLAWHLGILIVIALAIMALGHQGSVRVEGAGGSTQLMSGQSVPLGLLGSIAAFYAAIFGTSAGTSLNRESARREISWTKPLPRAALALRFIAIDIAGVTIAFIATLVAIVIVLGRFDIRTFLAPGSASQLLLALGIGVMWFALVQLLTFWFGPGARSISGILWPVALALVGVANVPGIAGHLARAIDIVNPLAYLAPFSFSTRGMALGATTLEANILAVWCFAIGFCAVPILLWPRKEA